MRTFPLTVSPPIIGASSHHGAPPIFLVPEIVSVTTGHERSAMSSPFREEEKKVSEQHLILAFASL